MSALPPELAPWADVLAGFAPDLAEAVGGLARRLDVLLGRVRARPRPRGDDPDGYDGLARRGPYDRLLLSEWAVADALPDEFDRRAVSGEHAFLRLDRRDPAKGVRTLVLFDAGPDNLGGPRVVQLAALVVLWRRALAAGAELSWGVLQGAALNATVDRASVQAFLAGRAARAATAEDLARHRAAAGEVDEVWLVGAPRALADTVPGALHLALADVIAPDVAAVDVRLDRGANALGRARLDLPPPALGKRLLTDPFPAPPAPVRSPTPRSRTKMAPPDASPEWLPFPRNLGGPWLVRFVPGTRQLLVGVGTYNVLAWGFDDGRPRSPKPRVCDVTAQSRVALGYWSQRVTDVSITGAGDVQDGVRPAFPAPGGVPPTVGNGHAVAVGSLLAFTDGAGALVAVPGHDRQHPVRIQGRCELLFRRRTELFAVIERGDGLQYGAIEPNGQFDAHARLQGTRAWCGGAPYDPTHTCFLLVRPTPTRVRAYVLGGTGSFGQPTDYATEPDEIPADVEVLGFGVADRQASVVTWDSRRNAIHHHGTNVTVSPARTPVSLTLSPDGKVVAWSTPEGFVEAWSLVTGDPLLLRYGPS